MKALKQQLLKGSVRILAFLILITAFACEGPQGTNGSDGIDGSDGVDGDVFAYSAIYDVYASEWEGDIDGYVVYLDVPEITADIFDNGAVLVYQIFAESFNLLPYTYVYNDYMFYMDFNAYVGSIELFYREVQSGVNDSYAPEDASFKIVIVEGIPLATLKGMVDVSDFNAVTKMLKVDVSTSGVQTLK